MASLVLMAIDAGEPFEPTRPAVFNVLRGEALSVRSTDYGSVGTLFAGASLEVVWVAKQGEDIDPGWFSQATPDVLFVVQGQLRAEFAGAGTEAAILGPGDALVLPPGTQCRAYRWPRDAEQATVFLAAYAPEPA